MLATEERTAQSAELKDFLLVLRQALLMVVSFIEKRYGVKPRHCTDCPLRR